MDELKKFIKFCKANKIETIPGFSSDFYKKAETIVEKLIPEAYHLVIPETLDAMYHLARHERKEQLIMLKLMEEISKGFEVGRMEGLREIVKLSKANPKLLSSGMFKMMESIVDNLIPEAYYIVEKGDIIKAALLSRLTPDQQRFLLKGIK